MGVVGFVGRAELRRRWGSVIVLTLLVGLVAAVVLASIAGARRTSSAFNRFEEETLAPDLTIFVPAVDGAVLDDLRAVPGVERIGVGRQYTATIDGEFVAAGGAADANFGQTVDRARVLEGRAARPERAHELVIPEPFARSTGLGVGDTVTIHGYTPGQIQAFLDEGTDIGGPDGPKVDLRIVGITRVPGDLSLEGDTGGLVLTTEAFTRRYGDQIGSFSGRVLRVRTTDSDAARRFVPIARARLAPFGQPGEFQVQPRSETGSGVREATGVVATGLTVFALVAGLAGVVMIAVAIRRYVDGGAAALPALRGLGVSQRERTLALAFPVLPVLVVGTALGVVGASLASALFPLGLARRAEPHLGLDVDGLVLGAGLLLTAGVVGGLGLWAAWAAVRAAAPSGTRARSRPSRASTAAVAAGCSPAVTVGMGMALDPGRGRTPIPVRSALAGTVVAVVGIVAVGVMAASLDRLEETPRAFGYNWDAHVIVREPEREPGGVCSPVQSPVVDDPAVAAAADTCQSGVEIEGYSVSAIGFIPLDGDIGPTVLAGRAPRTVHEVALGTTTLDEIDASIGDRVRIAGSGGAGRFLIVGRIAMPLFAEPGGDGGDVQAVADGAIFTGTGIAPFADDDRSDARIVVRWREGADVDTAVARLADLPGGVSRPLGATAPLEVDRLGQLRVLPWLLGGFLALIGMLAVGYGVVSAVHRRARDIAVLKTLGFRRRQVYETIGTQASVFGLVGLVLGIPVGVVVGRNTWDVVSDRAGLASFPTVPVVAVIAFAVVTLLLVNLVAVVPARRAARLRPAVVLRSE